MMSGKQVLGLRQRLRPVRRLAHHLDVGLQFEEGAQALAHHGMVVHNQHGDLAVVRIGRRARPRLMGSMAFLLG